MDEMKVKLYTKFMKGIVAKLISKSIYKKYGYKIDIQLNDLDIDVQDGEATVCTNVEVKLNSKEFMELMKSMVKD